MTSELTSGANRWKRKRSSGSFRDRFEFATLISFNGVGGVLAEEPEINHQACRFGPP
jgi:hypothetical protein